MKEFWEKILYHRTETGLAELKNQLVLEEAKKIEKKQASLAKKQVSTHKDIKKSTNFNLVCDDCLFT